MDAISNIGSSIGGFFKNNAKLLPGIATGVGALSNFMNTRKTNSILDAQLNAMKQDQALLNDPSQLAAKAASLERPLDAGLVSGVNNEVQGFLADRGLGESPTIAAEVEAQALGPYKQANQQAAVQQVLQLLQQPLSVGVQRPQNTDLTGLLKLLMQTPGKSGSGSGSGTSGIDMTPTAGDGVMADPPNIDFSNFNEFLDVGNPGLELGGANG